MSSWYSGNLTNMITCPTCFIFFFHSLILLNNYIYKYTYYTTSLHSLIIDFVGDTSFLLPGIGEAEDIVAAPLEALLIGKLFDSNFVTFVEFAKEILPGTDILPVATIAWFLENVFDDSDLAKLLQLGENNKQSKGKQDNDVYNEKK